MELYKISAHEGAFSSLAFLELTVELQWNTCPLLVNAGISCRAIHKAVKSSFFFFN